MPGLPPPVQNTNALALKTSSPATTDPATGDLEINDSAPPSRDASLDETEQILLDYISLLQKRSLLTINQHLP